MLALIIWEHDDPITGNIVKMESIVKPRKAIADYYEGERVSARLKGFGVPDGVIGKIAEESQRKELEDILRGKRFEALVQRIVHSAADDVPITENEKEQACTVEPGLEKIKLHRPKARKQPTGKPSEENKKKATEAAAAELELTELCRDVEIHQLENDARCDNSYSSASLVKSGLDTLLDDDMDVEYDISPKASRIERRQQLHQQSCDCQGRVASLEQEVWQLNQKLQSQESNISWLWSQVHQIQQVHQQEQQQSFEQQQQQQQQEQMSKQLSQQGGSENDAGTDKTCDDSRVVAGFTLSQLECKVAHLSSAPKVAALLFRTLFKEEDYVGKTLTGAGGKPKVDQERMSIIYSIINNRFPVYPMASLKHSLCDLLKPSRQKKKLC